MRHCANKAALIVKLFCATICLPTLALTGCGLPGDDGGGGGGGGGGGTTPTMIACGELAMTAGSGAVPDTFWPVGDTYGVNSFYLWQLDNASTADQEEYYYHSTGAPVTDQLPYENWLIPTTDWSAIRFNLDGLDPHKFTAQEPFYYGYLPYLPGVSWQSKFDAHNDGTCPENDYNIGGRPRCMGANQLDPRSPVLTRGKTYLFRMLMIIPLGYSNGENRVQSCYQKIVAY
jgi:hypothetical protein